MRKFLCFLLAVLMLFGVLSACARGPAAPADGKIRIVTTIFPAYDWVRQILGSRAEEVELTMLLDSGVDLHNFQPTADDIIRLSTCDMFVYVGGESDAWAEAALKEAVNHDMVVVDLLDALGGRAKEEETVEGMAADEEGEEDGPAMDEHIWLSLKNAGVLCGVLADALAGIDGENAAAYRENADAYMAKLDALDARYQAAVDDAAVKTLLFGDRFPFRYMADDYGLTYYAAFSGCSAETEASFETVAFLAGKVDELGLHSVMTIEGTDHRIAETIVANTAAKDQTVLTMNSLQGITAKDVQNGVTYLSAMEQDLDVLRQALR